MEICTLLVCILSQSYELVCSLTKSHFFTLEMFVPLEIKEKITVNFMEKMKRMETKILLM